MVREAPLLADSGEPERGTDAKVKSGENAEEEKEEKHGAKKGQRRNEI